MFFNRDLKKVLNETRTLKLNGVRFEIKKLTPVNYMAGANTMVPSFDILKPQTKVQSEEALKGHFKKIQMHFRDVFLASVVKPKLVRKDDGKHVCVDEIFNDWEMATELYNEIMNFTYGKKKSILSY